MTAVTALVEPQAEQLQPTALLRRLDWRFLFPQTDLGKILYIGVPQGPLWEALAAHCDSVVTPDEPTAAPASFEIAVVKNASVTTMDRFRPVLTRCRSVYVEVERQPASILRGASTTGRWQRALRSCGFVATAYWPRHGVDECIEYVPLGQRDVCRYVFGRKRSGELGKMIGLGGELFSRTKLLDLALPAFCIVGSRVP
jgi:hypothetical protein